MLPVSLDCQFFYCPSVISNVYLSCVLCTLCCFSGLSFFLLPSVYLSCVLCIVFLWIVNFFIALRYSLTFICPVSCVPYVASFSELSIFFIALRYSLTFICPVSCVPYVASFSGLSIFLLPFGIL